MYMGSHMIDFDIRGMGLVWEFSSAEELEANEAFQTCGIPCTPKWSFLNGKEGNANDVNHL